jgi:hypothetical protein
MEAYVHRRCETQTVNVTAYFLSKRELSRVDLADGQTFEVGYNLVIWNQGPAATHEVTATSSRFRSGTTGHRPSVRPVRAVWRSGAVAPLMIVRLIGVAGQVWMCG